MVFQIPHDWRVFVLDDTEERLAWFRQQLPEGAVRSAKTAAAALEILSTEKFDMVFLDHDLSFMDAGFPLRQHGNGKEVARYLAYSKFAGKIVIHSHSDQAQAMAKILPQAAVCRFDSLELTVTPGPARGAAGCLSGMAAAHR
jgi:CheY-like chemotaxis protein